MVLCLLIVALFHKYIEVCSPSTFTRKQTFEIKLSHSGTGRKCTQSPYENYKLLMTCWLISQATNLYKHSAYVVKEGCYMSFLWENTCQLYFCINFTKFTNLPFHISNLWLGCFEKQNWFYYVPTSLTTPKLIPHIFNQIIFILALM